MSTSNTRLFLRQMDVQFRVRSLNFYTLLLLFFQPAIFSFVGMLLSRAAGNPSPDLVYTVIGGGLMGMWSGLVFTSTYDIRSDRREGTLEMIVGSPTTLRKVEGIRTFTNVATGLISLVAAFLAALLLFKYDLGTVHLAGVLISLFLILFGLWCMGIFLANFMVWSRLSGSIVDYMEMPVALFCGFMFPISILPRWMQVISSIFPIRWALEAMRDSMRGSTIDQAMLIKWGISLGISILFFLAARWLDGKVHNLVRVSGELSSI